MAFTTVLFYLFSILLVGSAFRVVTAPNAVQSALFLVLAFFNAAGIWMLLHAEFLAIVLVLVYVGAVMVLFLFVVMMLDINIEGLRKDVRRFVPWATVIGVIIVAELALIIWHGYGGTATPLDGNPADIGVPNTVVIGRLLYTKYIFAFEIAGLILLVAIIAAAALTMRKREGVKRNDPSQQVRVRAKDRLRIVKMAAVVDAPDASTDPATPGNAGAGLTQTAGAAAGSTAPASSATPSGPAPAATTTGGAASAAGNASGGATRTPPHASPENPPKDAPNNKQS
ncbi:NADH-quinone oxidoreductase subunit J [Robbsia andropogonis]